MQDSTVIYKSTSTVHFGRSARIRQFRKAALLTTLIAVVTFAACELPVQGSPTDQGSLRVSIDTGMQSLNLLPDIDMDPAEYRLRGTGPQDSSFEASVNGAVVEINNLQIGQWQIEAFAINAAGIEVGYGQSSVVIEAAVLATVSIVVRPFTGDGSLSLSLSWPAAELQNAGIAASLRDRDGESQSLQFQAAGAGNANYHNAAIAAGYYTLFLQLLEGDAVVAGAVNTVRIVQGGHTEGSFSFADLNHPTGEVTIEVITELAVPLEVELSGVVSVLAFGGSMNASASVANAGASDVVYDWYLNGGSLGTGATRQLGAGLAVGIYRLDVVAFTVDGQRSGSATHSFRVE